MLAGVIWAIEHPSRGIVEPDEMDFARILEIAGPYLGDVVGVWGDWTPLADRESLFPEDLDRDDPWQFKKHPGGLSERPNNTTKKEKKTRPISAFAGRPG